MNIQFNPTDLLTPDELALRLKVRKSWVFEKTRRRSQDRSPASVSDAI